MFAVIEQEAQVRNSLNAEIESRKALVHELEEQIQQHWKTFQAEFVAHRPSTSKAFQSFKDLGTIAQQPHLSPERIDELSKELQAIIVSKVGDVR